eukprot:gb/GEZJ01006815.1/.p1 GENE.gb/GEZJ01006815.1/~~gb/GEZJ01006815.1/.p1  ORF type:complete len:338 (-),score=20.32 gb/GEZJ01006815.1/:553-1566(-)
MARSAQRPADSTQWLLLPTSSDADNYTLSYYRWLIRSMPSNDPSLIFFCALCISAFPSQPVPSPLPLFAFDLLSSADFSLADPTPWPSSAAPFLVAPAPCPSSAALFSLLPLLCFLPLPFFTSLPLLSLRLLLFFTLLPLFCLLLLLMSLIWFDYQLQHSFAPLFLRNAEASPTSLFLGCDLYIPTPCTAGSLKEMYTAGNVVKCGSLFGRDTFANGKIWNPRKLALFDKKGRSQTNYVHVLLGSEIYPARHLATLQPLPSPQCSLRRRPGRNSVLQANSPPTLRYSFTQLRRSCSHTQSVSLSPRCIRPEPCLPFSHMRSHTASHRSPLRHERSID